MNVTALRVVFRNLLRHKLRATLGLASVFLAAFVLHIYVGATSALNDFFSGTLMQSTLFVKSRQGGMWIASLPNHFTDEILRIPGVVAATPLVNPIAVVTPGRDPVFIMGIDAPAFRRIAERDLAGLGAEAYARFERDPSSILLSRGVALAHGLRAGTRVQIPLIANNVDTKLFPEYRAPFGAALRGPIVGEIERGVFSDRVLIVHRSLLERELDWRRSAAILVRFTPDADPQTLADRIEQAFSTREGGVEVLILDSWLGGVKTFVKQLSGLVLGFVALIGCLAAAILAHGVSRAAYQLLPELAVLRALGSSRSAVGLILAGEGLVVCAGGVGLATALIALLTSGTSFIDLKLIDPSVAPVFQLRWSNMGLAVVAGLTIALAGAALPALYMTRAPLAVLMKRRE